MSGPNFSTRIDQVVERLRAGMQDGSWRGTLPGRERLAGQFGVSHSTVEEAMRRLTKEGWLVSDGPGRRRRIVLPRGAAKVRTLRMRILMYGREDVSSVHNAALLDHLHRAGVTANYALKSLCDLGMDVNRVARFVGKTQADAWVVSSGSREVLEWFAEQKVASIAMFGRFTGLPIAAASPRIAPAMIQAVRRLVELGHRRIVMLVGEERRKPFPALFERLFLEQLAAQGLPVGPYNLPDWDSRGGDGLRACLDSMFRHTPPTAILCGETRFFVAVQQYLARQGIHAPEQVSLICSDPDSSFAWCKPAVSHFHWDHKPVVRRIVRWSENVARGKEDRRQILFNGEFVEGGTIGPVIG